MSPLACLFWGPDWALFVKEANEILGSAKPTSWNSRCQEPRSRAGQGGTGLVSAWAGALSGWSPGRSQRQWGWQCTHLQERVELLFLLPVHISFLKELEIGDEASAWSDVPRGMFSVGSKEMDGHRAHEEEGTAGEGVLGLWILLHSGLWEPVSIEWDRQSVQLLSSVSSLVPSQ